MATLLRIIGLVFMAVVPGGLLMLSAFVLARIVAARLRAQPEGNRHFTQALAGMTFRDLMAETRRSLS